MAPTSVSRRLAIAGAAAAMMSPPRAPVLGELPASLSARELGDKELTLESELEEMLEAWAAPRSMLTPSQVDTVVALVKQLESSRGRQQRAGWGQSDDAWDLPFIGSWDLLFATQQSEYIGTAMMPDRLAGLRKGRRAASSDDGLALVSARKWIYGPGTGGVATECGARLCDVHWHAMVTQRRITIPCLSSILLLRPNRSVRH